MTLTLENLEKDNQITQNEFEQLTGLIYTSVTMSNKDDKKEFRHKSQTLDFLIAFLNDYLSTHEFESNVAELQFIDFLSKLQLQKEVLQLATGDVKPSNVQSAIRTFAVKSQYPVGMR